MGRWIYKRSTKGSRSLRGWRYAESEAAALTPWTGAVRELCRNRRSDVDPPVNLSLREDVVYVVLDRGKRYV